MIMKQPKPRLPTAGQIGAIRNQPLVEEMQNAYLDYAMSVIVQRALPDARDGLKPVHRRILYAMRDMGLTSGAKFRKSATVVGEVLGKYHPHGDIAVYDSMVRLAQTFALRYPLINGQGNFGSIDGDGAAAMRYTESKLTKIAETVLEDIEKNTVDFVPNYDGTQKEPQVLPSRIPNLLLNGAVGIAVGMATSIPPHNLGELIDACNVLIENPDAETQDLLKFVKGPDFPTGGIVYGKKSIQSAYASGKGPVVIRAKTEIVEDKGNYAIIVTEIPYQVNKSSLLEKIAELVKDKSIEGIRDIRDESDKDGIRIVIELKKEAFPKKILNQLFEHTDLQTIFHFNMLALVDGLQPKVLNLKSCLEEFIKHRQTVVRRRTEFELEKARDRAHILEGLIMCLAKIDAVIAVIKKSADRVEAKINLVSKFQLSERQAEAILEMKLSQLANLERLRIETELKEKKKLIEELSAILNNPKKLMGVVSSELKEIRERFADERKTQVVSDEVNAFTQEDLIPDEAAIVILTRDGYLKRIPPATFKPQHRGGKGVVGISTKEEDVVFQLLTTTTLSNLLFFTTKGRVFQLKAYEVPPASRTARGQAVQNFLQLGPEENVSTVISLKELKSAKYLVMVTLKGLIKKVDLSAFESVRRSGLIAIRLKNDDSLEWVKPSNGNDEILLTSKDGKAIRFKEKEIRVMGRVAAGVRGMRLKGKDTIVGMDVVGKTDSDAKWLVITEKGFGKCTSIASYRLQGRGGSGIKTAKVTHKTGEVIQAFSINPKNLPDGIAGDLLVISKHGQTIRLPLKTVSTQGRATQGTRLMRFKDEDDGVASITVV